MKFKNTLISVTNMEASKEFYKNVLGLHVIADFGANVTLTGGLCLQTMESWQELIGKRKICLGANDAEIYFEEKDFDAFAEKLDAAGVQLVHAVKKHRWGQRTVRFYDPDLHIIEVGEDMKSVVRRFLDSGMTDEQVAERMDVPLKYIKAAKR